jgi:roadblock/LC7 domain-containing protein
MEDVLKMIFNADNVRMAVLLAAIACGVSWLKSKMDKRFAEQDAKFVSQSSEMNEKFAAQSNEMNEKFAAQDGKLLSLRDEIRELKTNDIAHLYAAMEALVFSMVKNKTLTETDQQYINDRLHSTH